MSSLEHHGIKGQKWGVRRFQNPDGTRTALGKKQLKAIRLSRNEEGIRQVYRSLSDRDLNLLGYEKEEIEANREDNFKDLGRRHTDYDQYNRVRYKNGDAVGYIAATGYQTTVGRGKKIVNILSIDLAVNSNYRGQGHSVELGKDIVRWFDRYGSKEYDRMEWYAKAENIASQKAAERSGFERKTKKDATQGWVKYSYKGKKVKHSSIGGNMYYIYGNTLVLSDSSYLEHHGIKGQRWGVRRFQNKDGSLTNAGRKRLGYSTKDIKSAVIKGGKAVGGAVATVGKAGYNLGKKAVAAGKAHSEKKKAEKLEKKKEKAAKTRLGVVNNADLFTAAEMAELNKKFKAKDEMTLASIQKGADYFRLAAGMVGSVASINRDFESMTGKSLIPNPVKKEKEKREADERTEDRARKLAKEDAEEDRKRRADERKTRADDIDFKNKSEDLKNKKSEELRKQAAEARAQAKQTWDEAQATEKTRAMKGIADENEAKAALKKQELKTNELTQREEAVAKREAALDESEERINYARKEVLKRIDDADTYRDALRKATDMLRNAHDLTREQQDEVWAFIKKAQEDKLGHDGMDGSYLEHHGIKGQRWGVRRFRDSDGTLTDKGRKYYQKKLDREDRKLTAAKAAQGKYERVRTPISVGMAVIGVIAGGLVGSPAGPAGIAAGAAVVSAIGGGTTYADYTLKGALAGLGANRSKKKIAKYENMLKQDGFIVEDGALYLEHHGIKGQKWGVRRFQNTDGTRTALGKKRDTYGATVSVRGQRSSENFGITKKQAKGKAAAEVLKKRNDLSEKERKSLQKHVDRAEKETEKLKNYIEKAKRSQEENTEAAKVEQWNALASGMLSPDRYKENIAAVNKNHKREMDYLNKMDERDMQNEKAFSAKTVAKGMGFALAATTGLAGITALATGTVVISGLAAAGGGTVGIISGELKRAQYRNKRRSEMGIDDPGRTELKGNSYATHDGFSIQNGVLLYGYSSSDELEHFGLKGMKWGQRRFQNKDGSLTVAGKVRYSKGGVDFEGGGGGGGAAEEEEDEELTKQIEEAAKKAGMTVDQYRKKMGSKLYDMFGGKYKKNSEKNAKYADDLLKQAQSADRKGDTDLASAAAAKRRGDNGASASYKTYGHNSKDTAKNHYENASILREASARDKKKYENSLAGKYDKAKASLSKAKNNASSTVDKGVSRAKDMANKASIRADIYKNQAANTVNSIKSGGGKSRRQVYGDLSNRSSLSTMKALTDTHKAYDNSIKTANYNRKQWEARASQAEKRGNSKTAAKYRNMAEREFSNIRTAEATKDYIDQVGDTVAKDYMNRNKRLANTARDAKSKQRQSRVAEDRADRRMDAAGAQIKNKIKNRQLPVNEVGNYASAAVDKVKADVSGKMAKRTHDKTVSKMGEAVYSGAKDYINSPKRYVSKAEKAQNRSKIVARKTTSGSGTGSVKVGSKHDKLDMTINYNQRKSQANIRPVQDIKLVADHSNQTRTRVLPKMTYESGSVKTAQRVGKKLTSKQLSEIRSEARIKQLKKDGQYTGEYKEFKKKRRK